MRTIFDLIISDLTDTRATFQFYIKSNNIIVILPKIYMIIKLNIKYNYILVNPITYYTVPLMQEEGLYFHKNHFYHTDHGKDFSRIH